jgi:cbb3-type cytochrome oxidase subunit 3
MSSSPSTNSSDRNAANNNAAGPKAEGGSRSAKARNGAILLLGDIVVALLLLAGVWSLYEGLGIRFEILEYSDLRAYGIPIGLLLLCLALVTARFWVFEQDRRGSDPRPVGSPPSPRPGPMPQTRFLPPGSASADDAGHHNDNNKRAA